MLYNDPRLIEAEKELEKAIERKNEEAMIYWFGYRNGVKWAIEKENHTEVEEDVGYDRT